MDFSVKDCYGRFFEDCSGQSNVWGKIWRSSVPPRVHVFLWKVHHGILPLNEFLYSRLNSNFHTQFCSWCSNGGESIVHLFMECELASWC